MIILNAAAGMEVGEGTMKKLITMFVLLAACRSEPVVHKDTSYQCSTDNAEVRAAFILKCIEAANQKADEEPEDWLYLCQKFATETYCPKVPAFRHTTSFVARPCSLAATPQEIAACTKRELPR
jgi:hypothetical protein